MIVKEDVTFEVKATSPQENMNNEVEMMLGHDYYNIVTLTSQCVTRGCF